MSACIIPVAPEFQDPPPNPTAPPYLTNPSQPFGGLVTVPTLPPPAIGQAMFTVEVMDSQMGVTLYYRWALDYPPFTGFTRTPGLEPPIQPPSTGGPIDSPVSYNLDCSLNPDPGAGSQHTFVLIVADRPFLNAAGDLTALDDAAGTGHVVTAFWNVNMSCQTQVSP